MREVTVSTVISAPREAIFDFVADLSARPSYSDHYLADYRLARANPVGLGAAARFRFARRRGGEWAEIAVTEIDRPRRIVEEGRVGRIGRSRFVAVYEFAAEAGGLTRVELTTFAEPATAIDRLKQAGAHRWVRRQTGTALERLRRMFEEPARGQPARVGVAGYDEFRAPRFGAHPRRHAEAGARDG